MYIYIPIGVFVLSILGIAYLILKKFVYLKKLSPEAISDPPPTAKTFWFGFFAEFVTFYQNVDWSSYKERTLSEFDKMIRKIRLLFLKIESFTHNISLKLRSAKSNGANGSEQKAEQEIKEKEVEVKKFEQLDPKVEEQHLIMEIAKNPKDALLYMKLGDIYLKTDEKENAKASFETVLQLDPENWYAKRKLEELGSKPT